MKVPAHKEHMFMLLVVFILLSIFSYLLGWRAFTSVQDVHAMMVPIFALTFMNTVLLVIMASFLLKMYEQVHT
jgi:hypothetical protein